jgi:hypothetical protein
LLNTSRAEGKKSRSPLKDSRADTTNASLNQTVTSRGGGGDAKSDIESQRPDKQQPPQETVVTTNPSISLINNTVKKSSESGEKKENVVLEFAKKSPILAVLILALILVIIVLAIVLPVTLVKPAEEREIEPRCPDGKTQPRVDCLPDKAKLAARGANLQGTCSSRGCCWSPSPESGGPNCAFPSNFGFRNFKTKENSFSTQWIELLRMNSPNSLAKSDISTLEFKAEMQSDTRLRIKVCLI